MAAPGAQGGPPIRRRIVPVHMGVIPRSPPGGNETKDQKYQILESVYVPKIQGLIALLLTVPASDRPEVEKALTDMRVEYSKLRDIIMTSAEGSGMPHARKDKRSRTMSGSGLFDPIEDAFKKIKNEFVNPESVLRQAGQKVENEFVNPESVLRQTGQTIESGITELGGKVQNEILNPESILRQSVDKSLSGEALSQFRSVDWKQIESRLHDALDPDSNGVADFFKSTGNDIKKTIDVIGGNIQKSAAESKAGLETAFEPLKQAFAHDSALSNFMREATGTKEQWEAAFKNPDTYFDILSVVVSVAAAACTGGAGAAPTYAAMQALIAGMKILTRAAQGKALGADDFASIATNIIGPIASGSLAGARAGIKAAGTFSLTSEALSKGARELISQITKRTNAGERAATLLAGLSTGFKSSDAIKPTSDSSQSVTTPPSSIPDSTEIVAGVKDADNMVSSIPKPEPLAMVEPVAPKTPRPTSTAVSNVPSVVNAIHPKLDPLRTPNIITSSVLAHITRPPGAPFIKTRSANHYIDTVLNGDVIANSHGIVGFDHS